MKELSLHLAFGILDSAINRRGSRESPRGSSRGDERHLAPSLPPPKSGVEPLKNRKMEGSD